MPVSSDRGGLVRRFHLEVLYRVTVAEVTRDADFEYRIPGRARRVSEAVYLLESCGLVELLRDGGVRLTDAGRDYLTRRETALGEDGFLVVQP